MDPVIGIDFGTSNSAVALRSPGGEVSLAHFGDRATCPSVLFYPASESGGFAGNEAVEQYLYRGLEGRFIQSMKAYLPVKSFSGTEIGGRFMSIEELVARFLAWLMRKAKAHFGGELPSRYVLGRPARFSLDPDDDALAEKRLRAAARLAGFGEVDMLVEPIAAALAYEATLPVSETVFVADLGGGTSDFTVMRVGPEERRRASRKDSILATGGVPVAGDAFDGEIVKSRLFPLFGYKSRYVALTEEVEVPAWLFNKLLRWNHVSFLKSRKTLEFLRLVERTSDAKEAIGALLRVVEDDLGYILFRAVERAKIAVAEGEAWIEDDEYDLPVRTSITRAQFEGATRELAGTIERSASEVLRSAGLTAKDVDAVFMTGGTSLVPSVREIFARMFGPEKMRSKETFTSVADGLARIN